MSRARAFTLTDLLIVIVMVLLVFGAVLPNFGSRARESANRIKCSSNLRQIALAMKMYANEEPRTNSFPRTIYEPGVMPTAYNQPDLANPFQGAKMTPNDVTAAMWLLLRTQDLTADVFACPATDAGPRAISGRLDQHSNFASQAELSYSLANPYPSKESIQKGYIWNDMMTADMALAADMSPGAPEILTTAQQASAKEMRKVNSPNHGFDGQNVMYADGHVDWATSPYVGARKDHIFAVSTVATDGTVTVQSLLGAPTGELDSVLSPGWDPAVPFPESSAPSIALLLAIGGGVLLLVLGGLGVILWLIFRGNKAPPAPPSGPTPPPLPPHATA